MIVLDPPWPRKQIRQTYSLFQILIQIQILMQIQILIQIPFQIQDLEISWRLAACLDEVHCHKYEGSNEKKQN